VGELLEPRRLLAFDSLIISEFMAANESVLADEDGEFSDWIELHNPTDNTIALDGWSLTDDGDQLDEWTLPDATLAPHEYLVVFASGKDRRTSGAPLHTNFRLDAEGEFLGLVDPAGTLVQSFGAAYPAQQDDVAYGLSIDQQRLVSGEGPGRWKVPQAADAAVRNGWTALDFDDSSWSDSSGPLGYDRRLGFPNVGFEAGDLSDWSSSGEARTLTSAGGGPPTQGDWQASLVANATSTTRFSLETFLGLSRNDLNRVEGVSVTRGSAIKRTWEVGAGTEFQVDWSFLTDEPSLNGSQDFAFISISPGNQVIKLAGPTEANNPSSTALDRETGYQTFRYTFPESGQYTVGIGVVNEANQFLDSGLLVDNLLINGVGSLEDTFHSVIQTSVAGALDGVDSSLWFRQPFEVSDTSSIEDARLRVRYDDGLAVYLNGQPLARRNAPAELTWNSRALEDRDDKVAMTFQTFAIAPEQLHNGENVLAYQVLKSAGDDDNLLLQADLTALGRVGETPVFLVTATPGAANIAESFGVAEPVQFSQPHGLYEQAFDLTLSTPTVGASILYTLDGSHPTPTNSFPYEGPIRIDRTQTVRALAIKEALEPSAATTQSYLFVEDVIRQSRTTALARGFPNSWGEFVADYEMDSRVIGQNGTDIFDGVYADTVRDDLRSIPTLSLVMDLDDLFGDEGIYSHPLERGVQWERPTSVELIYPDGSEGFQIDAGIRIQGGISRFVSSKMSLRLLFKDDYGPAKLEFPLFGPDAGTTFDSISLRSSSGEHLVGIHFLRDEFVRRSQLMTGNVASHGTFMHLYINGLYWGLYNPVERIDGQFAANYYGGDKDEYDVLNAGDLGSEGVSAVTGSLDAWNRLLEMAEDVAEARTQEEKTAAYLRLQGLNPDGTPNPEWESYLDVDNYIDYLITQVYVRNTDWPIRNYYMARRRGPDSTGFKFYVWDAEFTLDRGTRTTISSITREGPGEIFKSLEMSEAFRVDFSDRVERHFAPGGAYYVNPANRQYDPQRPQDNVPASLYAALADEVYSPLVPESARWGDEIARSGRLFVRDQEWLPAVSANLTGFFPNRSRDFLADLRRFEFYRDAPRVTPDGGLIEPGMSVTINAQSGSTFYTLDGSDPRNSDGSLSPSAVRYEGPLPIASRTTLLIRSLSGDEWSALREVTFYTDALPATPESLRITEVNYNPHDAVAQWGEANLDNDEFEFVEIANVGSAAVDLTGVRLAQVEGQGVDFTFGTQRLDVQQRVIVGRNRAALLSRFGNDLPLAEAADPDSGTWGYQGRLGNEGETITLLTASGQLIQRLSYSDGVEWPARADGGGSSLELIDLMGDLTQAASYRASDSVGGSPGSDGVRPQLPIVINEVLASPAAGGVDQVEVHNLSAEPVDISGWFISDTSDDLARFVIPPNTRLAPRGYAVFDERQLGFGLNGSRGDQVILVSPDVNRRGGQFVDDVQFDASETTVSLGRWPDGRGQLFPMSEPSLGARNQGPGLGDVIISEVHYEPRDPDGDGSLTGSTFEFVELYNRSGRSIDLSGWRVAGDSVYVFPEDTTLAPEQTLVVTGFDPLTNPVLVFAFALTFSTGPGLALFGPVGGSLTSDGGTVRLDKPATEDPDQIEPAWILVDRVDYSSRAPWADDALGTGRSLQRVSDAAFGNLASSWTSAQAAPGSVSFFAGLPGDVTQDGSVDLRDVEDLCAGILAGQNSAPLDVNRDGEVGLADFQTLILEVLQTDAGDANLDARFNSADLVSVFVAAEYEDAVPRNSTWSEGDWNCDGDFTTGDIVAAFLTGGYLAESRPADALVDVRLRPGAWGAAVADHMIADRNVSPVTSFAAAISGRPIRDRLSAAREPLLGAHIALAQPVRPSAALAPVGGERLAADHYDWQPSSEATDSVDQFFGQWADEPLEFSSQRAERSQKAALQVFGSGIEPSVGSVNE
jgi:hypothetical protein